MPVLERVVSTVRENTVWQTGRSLRDCLLQVEHCEAFLKTIDEMLGNPTAAFCGDKIRQLYEHLDSGLSGIYEADIEAHLTSCRMG